jgi:tetratricopeptide (TPR) repeat protein
VISAARLCAVCLVILPLVAACTSALKEPPPVSELGPDAGRVSTDSVNGTGALDRAETEFARLPDPEAVARARLLFLEAARAEDPPVEAYLGAARATAWLIEHTEDGDRRKELATTGVQIGQWCRRLFPDNPECTYRLALAVGQQARERTSTATDGLDVMVELLDEVIDEAPDLDFAGGQRVLALLLLRAPGWPTGPGDPEMALEHAEAAAEAFPDFPPNQLVLGEALLENGRRDEAEERLELGVELARALDADGHPEAADWIAQAEQALAKLR